MQVQEQCLTERIWYDTTQFCFKDAMSAIAIAYTRSGFVIAADGRQTSQASPGSEHSGDEISDTNQKVFVATAFETIAAYGITGFVGKGASYDLVGYAAGKARILSSKKFRSGYEYRDVFSQILERYIRIKKREGIIQYRENADLDPEDRTLIAHLHIVGYCHGRPFWVDAKFDHEKDGDVSTRTGAPVLVTGQRSGLGSDKLPTLALAGDPRFAKYRDCLAVDLRRASLELARDWVSAYVELCSEPLAAEIDPICKTIGGHVHVAIVTPENGFQWIVPPINFTDT